VHCALEWASGIEGEPTFRMRKREERREQKGWKANEGGDE
jgi:hypothetical protein